jgi:hypothetical protein
MADTNLKDLVKPPFANYDIVVYFGGGLFVLPFLRHYVIEPFGMHFPHMSFEIETPYVGELVFALALLFSVYICGHIIAYLASQLIEKAVHSWFGKPSDLILAECDAPDRDRVIRGEFEARLKELRSNLNFAGFVRAAFHAPAFPIYLGIYTLGVFGFFRSRVPSPVMAGARNKICTLNLPEAKIARGLNWYKIVEGYVINNYPIATSRMYNYLVINGLFRSISLIFLSSMWAEIFFAWKRCQTGEIVVNAMMTDSASTWAFSWTYALLSMVYAFALASHLKFSRRYVEEAIFAFVLTRKS